MQNIEKLIQLNAELEGLLHVLSHRDSQYVRTALNSKYDEFKTAFESLQDGLKPLDIAEKEEFMANAVDGLSAEEVKEQEAVSEEIVDETEASVEAVEKEEKTFETEDNNLFGVVEEEKENQRNFDDDEIVPVTLGSWTPKAEPDALHATAETAPKVDAEAEVETEPVMQTPKEEPSETQESAPVKPVSVEEMLSRKEAADLKRVFTLNDKIRFRRSLFEHDDAKFAEALETLAGIASFDEAKNTVVEQFGWNLENPEVEDFLSIIHPHYAR